MTTTFKVQTADVFFARSPQAPDGWLVFNAPRPLYGSLPSHVWEGNFIFGIFCAAVDPQGEFAALWVKQNIQLHATLLNFITRDQVMGWAREFCSAYSEVNVDDMDWEAIRFSYFVHHQAHETEITLP